MIQVDDAQVRWLASTMAARMLANAGSDARRGQLIDALRDWFPDADFTELSNVAKEIGPYFGKLATLIDRRTTTLSERGEARPLPGCSVVT